jgi:competence protein ComEC
MGGLFNSQSAGNVVTKEVLGGTVARRTSHRPRLEPFEHHQPLAVVVLALATGIVADRWLANFSWTAWCVFAWLALVAWAKLWRVQSHGPATAMLTLTVVALGGAWHHWCWNLFGDDELARGARLAGQPVCLEAIAVTGPRIVAAPPPDPLRAMAQGDMSRMIVRALRVRNRQTWQPASGEALLQVDGHVLGVQPGDRLQIFGQLARPEPQQNPGEFDFSAHHRADRRLYIVRSDFPECITTLEHGSPWNWRRWLDALRIRANRLLAQQLTQSQSPLAGALLLGERQQVDFDQTDAYFRTGTIHLFSISGLHVGILAGALFGAARYGLAPRRIALVGVAVLTIAYCLLTDSQPPVVRATILVVVSCFAWMSLRRPSLINALSLAAIVVLAINPADLFRIGPQLSFLAVATLAWFEPYLLPHAPTDPLDRLIARTRPWPQRCAQWVVLYFWKLFVVTTVIWAVALPLILYRFHLFSPVAMLLNPLIAIPVTFAMLAGFGTLVVGAIFSPAAQPIAWFCDVMLWLTQQAVDVGAALPNGHWYMPGPPIVLVLIFYAGLGGAFALPHWRPPRRWCVAILLVWTAALWLTPIAVRRGPNLILAQSELRSTFIAVGHGGSVLLELPSGKTLLYDAGQLGSPLAGTQAIAAVLWSKQISHLDAVIISHADVDHYNALPGLIDRFSIGTVYVSPVMFESDSPALDLLRQRIDSSAIPVAELFASNKLHTGDASHIEVLHPPPRGVAGSDNANSLVLLVEHGGRRLLLTGDLESPGLDDVLAEEPIDVDIALAPHHGSVRSSPTRFAQWCTPEYVLISGGHAFDSTAAEAAFTAAGATVQHTARDGAVEFRLSPGTLQATPWAAHNLSR